MKQDITKQKIEAALRILHAVSCWALCRYYKSIISWSSIQFSTSSLPPPSCVFWEGVHVSKGAGATTKELCLCQVKIYSYLSTWMVLDEPALMSLGLRNCAILQYILLLNGKGSVFLYVLKNHETRLCVCQVGSVMQKKNLTQERITPEISPLPLIFISWMVWFCW